MGLYYTYFLFTLFFFVRFFYAVQAVQLCLNGIPFVRHYSLYVMFVIVVAHYILFYNGVHYS